MDDDLIDIRVRSGKLGAIGEQTLPEGARRGFRRDDRSGRQQRERASRAGMGMYRRGQPLQGRRLRRAGWPVPATQLARLPSTLSRRKPPHSRDCRRVWRRCNRSGTSAASHPANRSSSMARPVACRPLFGAARQADGRPRHRGRRRRARNRTAAWRDSSGRLPQWPIDPRRRAIRCHPERLRQDAYAKERPS